MVGLMVAFLPSLGQDSGFADHQAYASRLHNCLGHFL